MSKNTFILFRIGSCSHVFLPDALEQVRFLGWSFLTLLSWRRCYILTCSFRAGTSWAHAFYPRWSSFTFPAGTLAVATASAAVSLAVSAFCEKLSGELSFKFLNSKLDESCSCDFLTSEICHLGFYHLDPPSGHSLCRDICLLPGFSKHTYGEHCVGNLKMKSVSCMHLKSIACLHQFSSIHF